MIKKYKNFILESKEIPLEDAIKEATKNGNSFSSFYKKDNDPEKDFINIQYEVQEMGWSITDIRKNHTNEELIQLYRTMSDMNGEVDIYFYKLFEKLGLDKNIVKLGGDGWNDFYVSDDEAFIRYRYGYHTTKYGLLSISQSRGGLKSFLEEAKRQASEHLSEYLLSELEDSILRYYVEGKLRNMTARGYFYKLTGVNIRPIHDGKMFNIREYLIEEEERIIIFAKEIVNFLNNLDVIEHQGRYGTDKKLKDIKEITEKDVKEIVENMLKPELKPFTLDIDFTGNEIIIWLEFKEH